MQSVEALPQDEKEHVKIEARILRTRINAVGKVLADDPEELHVFIASFSGGSGDTESVTTQTGRAVGSAPPCALYKELVTVQHLKKTCQEVWECVSKEGISAVKERVSKGCLPIKQLA
eukprot:12580375-Alexandrium_andersonii.AAC.1